jgi:hypothetical protein
MAVAIGWALAAFGVFAVAPPCPVAALLHVPCPSCGMTRALALAATGHLDASLRMHPLAVPALVATALFAASMARASYRAGKPVLVGRARAARFAVGLAAAVYAASLALWVARFFGAFGGPVPV